MPYEVAKRSGAATKVIAIAVPIAIAIGLFDSDYDYDYDFFQTSILDREIHAVAEL